MKSKRCLQWIVVALALAGAAPLGAVDAVPDAEFAVDPTYACYGVAPFGTQTAAQIFTVTNSSAAGSLTLGEVSLGGLHPHQFSIVADNCSNRQLEPAGHCAVQVTFTPTRRGTKTALLQIPSGSQETPMLTAFLTNKEDTGSEAQRRMPPVMQSLAMPSSMQANVEHTVTWSLLGYEDSYTSNIVFFDCTDETDCGAAYGDSSRFAASGNLLPDTVEDGDWTYHGFRARRFNYSFKLTPDPQRFQTAKSVVVRFYNKSAEDAAAERESLSLLLPGNLDGMSYHDNEGRRLRISIGPSQ